MSWVFEWVTKNAERWQVMWLAALMEDINPREAEELRQRYLAAQKGK